MTTGPLTKRELTHAWFPLWMSWLAMALEFPLISAFVSRLPNPEVQLAAFGGIVIPFAFFIEAPIIPLLSASTALSRDYASYRKLFRIMMWMGLFLTGLHALATFTPLYDFIVVHLLDSPKPIVEPGRMGMACLLVWTWAIGFRRFHQGILIRFHATKLVTIGTMIRLLCNVIVGLLSWYVIELPGILVASIGVMSGVFCEATFIGIVSQSIIRQHLRDAPPVEITLSTQRFLKFFSPLVVNSLLDFSINPILSAAVSRMPLAVPSLAILSPLWGLAFALRSAGFAFTEIVISRWERPGAKKLLSHFTIFLTALTALSTALLIFTPLRGLFFESLLGFSSELHSLAVAGLFAMILPILVAPYRAFFQGRIIHAHRTHDVTIGTFAYLITTIVVLIVGVKTQSYSGIVFVGISMTYATIAQVLWLWRSARRAERR